MGKIPQAGESVTTWDRFWTKKDPASIYPSVTDIVAELKEIGDVYGKKVLETGAGTGRDGIRLSRLGAEVWLLDYSRASLDLARHYTDGADVRMVLADARVAPFKDGSFDVVFHQGLLEHFTSPDGLLRENSRILRQGGFIIVDVPQTYHVYTLLKQVLILLGCWFAGWERQFTLRSLARLLRKHGLEPVHYFGDWSRPGIFYKISREVLAKIGLRLPMHPRFFGPLTDRFYLLQERLRKKRLFLYTALSIGIIARKARAS
jgi:SAM-dependent methyltransferase